MKCFYHTDHDGHASGAIVKMAHPECTLFPLDYNAVFPMSKMQQGEEVVLVDISLSVADMMELANRCHLVYIDHHKSAIQDLRGAGLELAGLTDITEALSACELTWQYYFPELDIPEAISLLGRYDVFDLTEECLDFEYGLRAVETDPAKSFKLWTDLCQCGEGGQSPFDLTLIDEIKEDGAVIRQYLEQYNKQYTHPKMFVVLFEGLRFLVINHPRTDSTVFDGVFDPNQHDAMMVFRRGKACWEVSLYGGQENTHDLSVIAKKYGGGGHEGSAGFKVKRLPFEV